MESQWIRFSSPLQRRSPTRRHHQLLHQRSNLQITTLSIDRRHCVSLFHRKRHLNLTIHRRNGQAVTKSKTVDEEDDEVPKNNKGTVAGAVALIVGTSIGSGILALPKMASPAGLIPSSVSLIICWAFLVLEALLLVEINVNLRRNRRRKVLVEEDDDLDVISMRTMAEETLGQWGGAFAMLIYVFLGYTSMVAYCSKAGEIIFRLLNLPEVTSSFVFTFIFSILISIGGTKATDRVNQWMTASMIGLLLAIEGLSVVLGGWSVSGNGGNWDKVPLLLPVMIFSLVYHDTIPVLCAYLGGDLNRIRRSIVIGSVVPLLALLLWDAIALGLANSSDSVVDPVDLLLRVRWGGVAVMVEVFSLLAVGTSLLGTLLGFSAFFKEQLNKQICKNETSSAEFSDTNKWLSTRLIGFTSLAIVVGPSLLVSATVPDVFSTATDIAGGYCMTILYGVLPPAMAWAVNRKESKKTALVGSNTALIGVAIFAVGVVMEQLLKDLSALAQ